MVSLPLSYDLRSDVHSTTDHISAAGAWLKYKGHLSNISENTLMTAVNDEGGNINVARDQNGEEDTIPRTMQKYKGRNEPFMLVVDDNCMFAPFSLQSKPDLQLLINRWRGIST